MFGRPFGASGIGGRYPDVTDPNIGGLMTDTDDLQRPVDYALAGDQDQKKSKLRRGQPGQMTKSMLNKIFKE